MNDRLEQVPAEAQPWQKVTLREKMVSLFSWPRLFSRVWTALKLLIIERLGGIDPSKHSKVLERLSNVTGELESTKVAVKIYHEENTEAMRKILPQLVHLNQLMKLAPVLYPNIDPKTAVVLFLESSYLEALIDQPNEVIETISRIEKEQLSTVLELTNSMYGTPLAKIPYVNGVIDGVVEIYDAAKSTIEEKIVICKKVTVKQGTVIDYQVFDEFYLKGKKE